MYLTFKPSFILNYSKNEDENTKKAPLNLFKKRGAKNKKHSNGLFDGRNFKNIVRFREQGYKRRRICYALPNIFLLTEYLGSFIGLPGLPCVIAAVVN